MDIRIGILNSMKEIIVIFFSQQNWSTGPKLESFCAHWKKIVDLAVKCK